MRYGVILAVLWVACDAQNPADEERPLASGSPEWVRDAVFYQIFPGRFRNGDLSNDPVRSSLDHLDRVPESWETTPWTSDWYARADWERGMGEDFYSSVFSRRYGGDLQGVIARLDYLDSLGITALYFNPLFHARSLHKYDGTSFHHIDPHFGPDPVGDLELMKAEVPDDPATWVWTSADSLFLELVEALHVRGMRIVLDGVFNHTGRDFFAFTEVRKHQSASAFVDWYNILAWDDAATEPDEFDYEGWWGFKALPVFADTEDGSSLADGPAAYVMAVTRRWMDPDSDGDPSDGIDGWRLDVPTEVPVGFWLQWHEQVRRLNPGAYTVAEIWDAPEHFLRSGGLSGAMNYHGFAYPVKGFLIDGSVSPSVFSPPTSPLFVHLNLVDSHDTDRVASMIVNGAPPVYAQPERFGYDQAAGPRDNPTYVVRPPSEADRQIQRLVALVQFTWDGAPMIYYGTEAGMWGADDPDGRMPMVWPDLVYDDQMANPTASRHEPSPVAFDSTLFGFYRELIRMRHENVPLRRGSTEIIWTDETRLTWAFRRTLGMESVVVLINRGDSTALVTPTMADLEHALRPRLVVNNEQAPAVHPGDPVRIEMPARTGIVLMN